MHAKPALTSTVTFVCIKQKRTKQNKNKNITLGWNGFSHGVRLPTAFQQFCFPSRQSLLLVTHSIKPNSRATTPLILCMRWLRLVGSLKLQVSFAEYRLVCRILSLLSGSFAKETYNLKEPTNRSHPICILFMQTPSDNFSHLSFSILIQFSVSFSRALRRLTSSYSFDTSIFQQSMTLQIHTSRTHCAPIKVCCSVMQCVAVCCRSSTSKLCSSSHTQ